MKQQIELLTTVIILVRYWSKTTSQNSCKL